MNLLPVFQRNTKHLVQYLKDSHLIDTDFTAALKFIIQNWEKCDAKLVEVK